ncbi:MaoC/PaaZ C-terminal domain-containing protein [Nocardia sp. NPDC051990]|uniref:MaoC/PaaZ C-terminal domain-containing protein n=1 Tax=Nocardia sp. NPDC051990 TaxID=3155285 RepID=UPI003427F2D0
MGKPQFSTLTFWWELSLGLPNGAESSEYPRLQWTETVSISREDVSNFAHISGDSNPIHLCEHSAQAAGFPTTIAHGMHLMGLGASFLIRGSQLIGRAREQAVITHYRARFANPVLIRTGHPAAIELCASVRSSRSPSHHATAQLIANSADSHVLSPAAAELIWPDGGPRRAW